MNDNCPVLRATVGNRSVRDPFIRACADGWYHLLSTDSWHSPNLLHTRSRDLLHWEAWDVIPIMAAISGTRNAWAPEFFFDAARQVYLVFWASVTHETNHQRIWFSETTDFRDFTRPSILFDPGYSVIDATLVEHEGCFFLIYKDERGENRAGTDFKAMRVATAPNPRGPYTVLTGLITPTLTEGPALFQYAGCWRMLYDCFMDGAWGAAESDDLLHWQALSEPSVPSGARHGTVFQASPPEHTAALIHARF